MPVKRGKIKVFLTVLAFFLLAPGFSSAQMLTGQSGDREPLPAPVQSRITEYESYDKEQPVDLSADSLQHDEAGQTITASGHVEMAQGRRILKADEVVYNLATDTVVARGHVVLTEPNGDVHFADEAQLNNEMKEGFVNGLQTYLAEGGRFTAKEGRREGNNIIMRDAAYTPCECDEDEEGNPAWQIRADEVIYIEDENRIKYKNARFEMFGVPLAWSPYLSHPDGKVKRKSGFLSPQVGFDSQLGVVVTSNYYWNLAPDHDATTGLMMMTGEAPVALGEYRRRFDNAEMKVNGSVTYSDRTESDSGIDVKKDEDFRGHLFADARWDVNEQWRAGTNVELTSDDQYLRQYDFSGQDVLENEVYAERFSGRNYAVGRLLAFQDVRVREERADQPNVLPELIAGFKGEPNGILGGRWALDLSGLGLERDGNGQDMNRAVAVAGWQRRDVTGFGLVNTLDLSLRGDFYSVRDRDLTAAVQNGSGEETRFFPSAHMVSSYPVAKSFESMQAVVEPVAALTVSPNIEAADSDIPNEDSQDVQLDASNLFEANRFPGLDRIEDGSHATYGMRTGLHGHKGSFGEVFLGQSYRFNQSNNPFPDGSGLSTQESDIVGQVSGAYSKNYGMNYRFQLDSRHLESRRHELDAFANWERGGFNTRYLFAKALEGTDIDESREQIENSMFVNMTRKWRLRGGALHDLGEDPGLRKASVGLDYFGCCLSFSTTAQRTLTTDSSGDSGTDVTFRIGLKGLGEFQSSGGSFGGGTAPAPPPE